MTKHRDFSTGQIFPAGFLDAMNEYLGTTASPNLTFVTPSAASLRVPAASGDDQVAIAIDGQWRFNSSNADAAHPGGVAGTYPVWATSRPNNPTSEDAGIFDYSWLLKITAAAGQPTGTGNESIFRKIAEVEWDGSSIVAIRPLLGALSTLAPVAPHAAASPVYVKGAASQSAPLVRLVDSAGAQLGGFGFDGRLLLGTDADIRRSGANAIRTDDTFDAAALTINGAAVALDADARFPTADQKAALAGTSGTPSAANRYVTDADTRLANLGGGGAARLPGEIIGYAGNTAPSGWLLCNGAAVSRTTYADLNAVLAADNYPYGNGNGSSTFNVPDLQGRIPVMKGTKSYVDTLGKSDGQAVANRAPVHRHTTSAAGGHNHTGTTDNAGGHNHTPDTNAGQFYTTGPAGTPKNIPTGSGDNLYYSQVTQSIGNHAHGFTTSTFGNHLHDVGPTGDTALPLDTPAYLVINYIIKA